ncbi:glycoside hydrolase family 15 protein [Halarchaeum sp. P4]|uniref:glycoside hydrolase family 15 protein n=1 Tax=Halarchaeum sp. P4 TaxID=3421639 RepID=UPI003EB9175A
MHLRDALDDYKRHHDDTTFAGERRTTTGRFSGIDGRLVHVSPDGALRDFSYALTGRNGIERSRLGVRIDDTVHWFDDYDTSQRYDGTNGLVVTDHGDLATQYDLTVGDGHVTHVEAPEADALVAYVGFGPDRQETQLSQLRTDDTVEVYHDREHDFIAGSADFASLGGEPQLDLESILAPEPVEEPRAVLGARYETDRLSGDVVVGVPITDGRASVATLLSDRTETTREEAQARVRALARDYDSAATLRREAERQHVADTDHVPSSARTAVDADLRVLSLLSTGRGARIAGPDFDPFYTHSGGYGYTWFRDDAEISQFLLAADDAFDLDLEDWHEHSARFYCDTQRPDGTWPHRVWPRSGALAPGWANGRIEDGDGVDYQADQTGSVVSFLATYRPLAPKGLRDDIDTTLAAALDGLDATLADDGRPAPCQNAWEDATGRFSHTAATFLEAYAALAALPGDVVDTDRAATRARTLYDALDDLWCPERGIYALREVDGELDDRADSAALALADAHRAYARIADVDAERLDRLVSHTETVCEALWRETDAAAGLVRYEGDGWRRSTQDAAKIWTVSTAWGAHATGALAALLDAQDDGRADVLAARSRDLLATLLPDGPLAMTSGYLPEQVFDDGTPDSATPLGWPHAIRTATLALYEEEPVFQAEDGSGALAPSPERLD